MSQQLKIQEGKESAKKGNRISRKALWEQWAAEAQQGDRTAQERLFALLHPWLLRIAIRRLGNEADALDAVQESLLKIFLRLESFDPARGCFAGWAGRICSNEIVNVFRHGRSRKIEERACDELPSDDGDPVALAEAAESRDLLRSALDELPAEQKEAVHLHFVEELTFKEAAAVLGVPLATTAGRTYRGLASLRNSARRAG
jgi:RNA polymerase sigma-70 factor (ECF subfamily)